MVPVPQENLYFVEQASYLLLTMVPVPQENLYFVEQESCLLLKMVQNIS